MSENDAVAALFEEYADRLEAQDDEYRPRSYRRAAENVREYPAPVEELAASGADALQEIDGVGESIAEKIVEYVETGEIAAIEAAREELPVDMAALTSVGGVGPKTVGDLYAELGVETLDDLEAACRAGEVRELDGYGETTESNILENIPFARSSQERSLLGEARPIADAVLAHLRESPAVERCDAAGSLRRWQETIGDVDVLAAGTDHAAIVDRFLAWDGVSAEIESGTGKASVRTETAGDAGRLADGDDAGTRVDLRVVDPAEWGAALQYFTGSRAHNVGLRNHAIDRELKVNEYGVFDVSGVDDADAGQRVGERIAGETEASVYEALELDWIPPELREDGGEIDAAASGSLPELLTVEDIRGDLHVHTDWSDGGGSIERMIGAASEYGHEYVAITDHATGPGVVGGMGLDDADLRNQLETIRSVAPEFDVEVLAGVEANVDADGGLSVGEELLKALDIVVASPHAALSGSGTERLCSVMEAFPVDVLGHPSGRLLNDRSGLDIDPDAIGETAAETGTALEVNANPARLDLWGEAVRSAVSAGATVAVNTDAHSPVEFDLVTYGVHTARRGWARAADVLNTYEPDRLRAFLG